MAGGRSDLSATQRLAMYIVISKPNRMSVADGRSHFIVDPPLVAGTDECAPADRQAHGGRHEDGLMIFWSFRAAMHQTSAQVS
jgi:hypothetical protein